MTRLPRAKGREIVRALQRVGFDVDRTRGSHVSQTPGRQSDRNSRPLRRTLGPGLLRAILRDVEMSVDELTELL